MSTRRRRACTASLSAASRRACAKPASATASRWRSPRRTSGARATSSCDGCTTRGAGHYETGLWDVRAPTPRPTALATLVRQLAHAQTPDHPALAGAGWWQRELRLLYRPVGPVRAQAMQGRPLLIIGATGTLGR